MQLQYLYVFSVCYTSLPVRNHKTVYFTLLFFKHAFEQHKISLYIYLTFNFYVNKCSISFMKPNQRGRDCNLLYWSIYKWWYHSLKDLFEVFVFASIFSMATKLTLFHKGFIQKDLTKCLVLYGQIKSEIQKHPQEQT